METNLRSLVALVLLVPFLAGKFVHSLLCIIFPERLYSVKFCCCCCSCCFTVLVYLFSPVIFSVLNEDKAIIMYARVYTCHEDYTFLIQLPSLALMEQFVWLMDQLRVQAGWRSASMECGEEYVVIIGMILMGIIPELFADSWGTMLMQEKVS